jgi:hypothetical protein
LQTANAKAGVATIGRQIEVFAVSKDDEIDAAFREHGAMAFSMRAAVIRIVRAISRRTPNADEGHLRLRRRLTEQARCAIKIPRGSVVWPRAWRVTIDIKPGRNYPRSSPTSRTTAYN